MADPVSALLVLAGGCFAAMAIGASFTIGVASICRWMNWAPINTAINFNNYGGVSIVPADPEGPPDA